MAFAYMHSHHQSDTYHMCYHHITPNCHPGGNAPPANVLNVLNIAHTHRWGATLGCLGDTMHMHTTSTSEQDSGCGRPSLPARYATSTSALRS